MTWKDYLIMYLIINFAVFSSLMIFRIVDNYARYKRTKKVLDEIQSTINSEIEFRNIVTKLKMDGDF